MKFIDIMTTIRDYIGIPGIIALLICFISPLLAYCFRIKAQKKGFILEDVVLLEKAFNPTLYHIREGINSSYFIVHTEFGQHENAIKSFPMINKGLHGFCFKRHWSKYKKKCNEIRDYGKSLALSEKDNFPEDFLLANDSEELKRDNDNKKELVRLINKLLDSAKKF
ncbi:MAG: hypothetical protein HY753_02420 [Nitrospirae bacterium]|nr:hypothetical protein [Nitrospirota bacterium]